MTSLLEAGGFGSVSCELLQVANDGSIVTADAERRSNICNGIARLLEAHRGS